jgi:hypothetical protein
LRNYSVDKLRGMLGTITNPAETNDFVYQDPALLEGLPVGFDWR